MGHFLNQVDVGILHVALQKRPEAVIARDADDSDTRGVCLDRKSVV